MFAGTRMPLGGFDRAVLAKADQWLDAIDALGRTFETGFAKANRQADHILGQVEKLDRQTKAMLEGAERANREVGRILEDTRRINRETAQHLRATERILAGIVANRKAYK